MQHWAVRESDNCINCLERLLQGIPCFRALGGGGEAKTSSSHYKHRRDHIKGSPHSDGVSGRIRTLRILPAGMCQIGLMSGENSHLMGLQNQTVILPRKSSEYREQEYLRPPAQTHINWPQLSPPSRTSNLVKTRKINVTQAEVFIKTSLRTGGTAVLHFKLPSPVYCAHQTVMVSLDLSCPAQSHALLTLKGNSRPKESF